MLPDFVPLKDLNYQPTSNYDMNDLAFNFPQINNDGVMTQLFRGLLTHPAGKVGGFFSKEARDILNFSPSNADNSTNQGGFDLLAWNINRGRDHGLPGID